MKWLTGMISGLMLMCVRQRHGDIAIYVKVAAT